MNPSTIPRRILDNLREGVQVIDPELRYVYVNDAAVAHGRTTRDQLEGRVMMDAYPGIESTEVFAVLRDCLATRLPAVMENEFTFADGSRGWFELRFDPVPDGVAILSLDITERKRAERSLQRSLRVNRILSRCNYALVRSTDEIDFLREVCRILVEIGEYTWACVDLREDGDAKAASVCRRGDAEAALDELTSDGWHLSLNDAVVADARAQTRRATDPASDVTAGYGAPIRLGGECVGALIIGSDDAAPFLEDERALLDEVALDVGFGVETLRARRARRREQARTRAMYDRLPHPTFVWRRTRGGFELFDCNDAARTHTGGGAAAALGAPPEVAAPGLKELDADLERCLADVAAFTSERECVLPGGTERRLYQVSFGCVTEDHVLMIAQDVTEQRETEEQLVRAQRLEAVGQLAGGVAHDFNNLLSVILVYAEMVLGVHEMPEGARADVREIREAGRRAAQLTSQLLAFSRKRIFAPSHVHLNAVLLGLEDMLRRLLREDIDVRIAADAAPDEVLSDPGQLEQVIVNLVVNARDAMPDGGALQIETAFEQVAEGDLSVSGPCVCLTVRDTGVGMSDETVARIFEPFFTTKEVGHGTGLGLATVYGIVKQSGGDIRVRSEPGRGSEFVVYVPHAPSPEAVHQPRAPRRSEARGDETILVIEDDDNLRRAVRRILSSAGFVPLLAADGEEAVRIANDHEGPIHLVLSDVVMPGMSGPEAVHRIAQARPDAAVVLTSGYSDDAVARHGGRDPRWHYLAKPFSGAELRQRVRDVLDDGAR